MTTPDPICALCGLPAGDDATTHLTDDFEIFMVHTPDQQHTAPAGVMPTCARCTAWLPDWRGPLPEHLVAAIDSRVPFAFMEQNVARETRAELHRVARQIARGLNGDAR